MRPELPLRENQATALAMPVPIVALDVPTPEEALALVARLPRADFFKVGLQLYTAAGPEIVRRLTGQGKQVFLDLKLHDIPNTVAGAVRSAAALEVDILTVHASGGEEMLTAAMAAANGAPHPPKIFAVTVLTSLRSADLTQIWGPAVPEVGEAVAGLARLADRAGVDGVVAAVGDIAAIRAQTRSDLGLLTPGIRLPGGDHGDQARVATPEDAVRAGVDFMVIGRAVTAAADPVGAYEQILAAIGRPSSSRGEI